MVCNEIIQGNACTTERNRISAGIGKRTGKHGKIPMERFLCTVTEIADQKIRITEKSGKKHVVNTQRDLACADRLLPTAEEQGNIRGTGTKIKYHETAPCIIRCTETEIGSESRTLSCKGNRKDSVRNGWCITAFLQDIFTEGDEQIHQCFTALFCHFIRHRETPCNGGSTFETGLQGSHEHDLMETQEA